MLELSCIKVGLSISIPQPNNICAKAGEPHVTQFLLLCSPLVQQEKPISSILHPEGGSETWPHLPLPQHLSLTWGFDGITSEEKVDEQFWQPGQALRAALSWVKDLDGDAKATTLARCPRSHASS